MKKNIKNIQNKITFRIKAKSIFLTYSKSNMLSREIIFQTLNERFKEKSLSGLAVCQEKHKDGSNHYHVFLDFSKSFETENARLFDIEDDHPNVQGIRNREKALAYLLKEDKHVLMDKHMDALCGLWDSTVRHKVEQMLQKGYGPDYTATLLGDYGYKHPDRIRKWWKVLNSAKIREKELQKDGWIAVLEKFKGIDTRIYDALEIAHKYEGKIRPLKTLNLLLWSTTPSYGKTTFTLALQKHLKTFDFPTDGWWDGYDDNFYQLIIWNECSFVGWQIQQINKLFDGSSMQLPIKGSKQTKTDNPLIVCTSNLDLTGLLKQKGYDQEKIDFYLPILRTRIQEVEIRKDTLWPYLEE